MSRCHEDDRRGDRRRAIRGWPPSRWREHFDKSVKVLLAAGID